MAMMMLMDMSIVGNRWEFKVEYILGARGDAALSALTCVATVHSWKSEKCCRKKRQKRKNFDIIFDQFILSNICNRSLLEKGKILKMKNIN